MVGFNRIKEYSMYDDIEYAMRMSFSGRSSEEIEAEGLLLLQTGHPMRAFAFFYELHCRECEGM